MGDLGLGTTSRASNGTELLGELGSGQWTNEFVLRVATDSTDGIPEEVASVFAVCNSINGAGVVGWSEGGDGVWGIGANHGVRGTSDFTGGSGVWGEATDRHGGFGVFGSAHADSGTHPEKYAGVWGDNQGVGTGVLGTALGGTGVVGLGDGNGVAGFTANAAASGVYGQNDGQNGGSGVVGRGQAYGVYGECTNAQHLGAGIGGRGLACGVHGSVPDAGVGVIGSADGSGIGVYAISHTGVGVWGAAPTAGFFQGNVQVNGTITHTLGRIRIDHPSDPQNRYLEQGQVGAGEHKTVHDGIVVCDDQGRATVDLPPWFAALHGDLRYQLTCVGGYAPVYIARKADDGRFQIAGGEPGLEVCWQVTGVRQDLYARANPIVVEREKSAGERGHYLHPDLYGSRDEAIVPAAASPAPPHSAAPPIVAAPALAERPATGRTAK